MPQHYWIIGGLELVVDIYFVDINCSSFVDYIHMSTVDIIVFESKFFEISSIHSNYIYSSIVTTNCTYK